MGRCVGNGSCKHAYDVILQITDTQMTEVIDPNQLKGKEKYAHYQNLYNKYEVWSRKDLKKRPDLAMLQDYLRTANPNTEDIPENAKILENECTDAILPNINNVTG